MQMKNVAETMTCQSNATPSIRKTCVSRSGLEFASNYTLEKFQFRIAVRKVVLE